MDTPFSQPVPLALLGALALVVMVLLFRRRASEGKEAPPSAPSGRASPRPERIPVGQREPTAIYQFDPFGTQQRLVGRVSHPEVDEANKQVRFEEIYNSDELCLADECEFQNYRLLVRRVGDCAKVDKENPRKGRVLRTVVAELLGYSEQ